MGEVHARNLRSRIPGATLVAVSDVDAIKARDVASALDVTCHDTGEALIADPLVDAVLIASSDHTHAQYVMACIGAAKPMLCEKPLAISSTEAWSLVEREVASGRRSIQVGFMREFDATHVALRTAVADGSIGRPVMFRGTHINPFYGWSVDIERAVTQSLVHDIHSARFLMGREIVEVYGTSVDRDPGDTSATRFITVSLRFDDGAVGLLDLNMDSGYGYAVAAEVVGTAGTARTVDPVSIDVSSVGRRSADITPGWAARFSPAYVTELEAWVGSLHSGVPIGPTAYDGYMSNVVADACVASVHSGAPVAVRAHARPALYER
jgi:myo-inositol 2-dehydrogenase / D-chiro-inositol 1-dehydrogenase